MNAITPVQLGQIFRACEKHQVASLHLFGSAARGRLTKDSDYDFLVNFLPSLDLLDYADNFFGLLEALGNVLGRKVDLVSEKSLKNPVLIEEIYKTKVPIYESQDTQIHS